MTICELQIFWGSLCYLRDHGLLLRESFNYLFISLIAAKMARIKTKRKSEVAVFAILAKQQVAALVRTKDGAGCRVLALNYINT